MAVRTAIVVEGGAMRGVFPAGVLDVLHEEGLTDFDLAIGSSAGACNLASFVAGQHQRNLRCYVEIMARAELFSLRRALSGGHYMDLDWLWERFAEEEPLDELAVERSRTELVSVATCARTGRAVYHTLRGDVGDGLKGGCAMPLAYRGPIQRGDELLVDGVVTDPIPAAEAYRRGARRMLVVRTRPSGARAELRPLDLAASLFLREHPELARAFRASGKHYRAAEALLLAPPADLELVHIHPEQPLRTRRTTRDVATLRGDYELGRAHARRQLAAIAALL